MKISEVCRRTGLTERTVRYYEEEKLIQPETSESGGRIYREYSEKDIRELETISALRKLLFTIEEIKTMKQDPVLISVILSDYRSRLQEMNRRMTDVLDVIDRMDMRYVTDVDSLARGFSIVAASRSLPAHDVTPNFGKFDQIEEGEKERARENLHNQQQKRIDRGEKMIIAIVVVEIIGSILNVVIDFGNILGLIVTSLIVIGLMNGKLWVRTLYVILLGISIFSGFYTLMMLPPEFTGLAAQLLTAFLLAMMIWRIVCIVLLLASPSVDAYLDYKRK